MNSEWLLYEINVKKDFRFHIQWKLNIISNNIPSSQFRFYANHLFSVLSSSEMHKSFNHFLLKSLEFNDINLENFVLKTCFCYIKFLNFDNDYKMCVKVLNSIWSISKEVNWFVIMNKFNLWNDCGRQYFWILFLVIKFLIADFWNSRVKNKIVKTASHDMISIVIWILSN